MVVEDLAIGGQAGTASRIENCMGFPNGISGADLCWCGEIQAMKFGTRFAVPHRLTGLAPEEGGWCLTLDNDARVRAGIFAVGDVRAGSVKRVASGVGEGAVVMSEVWRHLNPR